MFHHIAEVVNRYLLPPDPIILSHAIHVDERMQSVQAFDIDIDVDDLGLKSKMNSAYVSLSSEASKNISALDEEVNLS